MKPGIAHSILTVTVALLAMSCSGKSSPSEPAPGNGNSLSLQSISPVSGTQLAPGSTVTFRAVLQYSSQFTSNAVGVQLEDQAGNTLVGLPTTAVPIGNGVVALDSTFQIPASGTTTIVVAYLLYAAVPGEDILGQATANYPVGP
jgi:hypothetical protein